MRYYRVLASAAALAAVISFAGVADAGGSSGGLIGGGSSGASSGGAFGARLASLKSRLHSGGSSGGASHGSSGGGALRARLSSLGSRIGSGSSGGGGLLSRIKSAGSSGGSGGSTGGGLLSRLGSKLHSGGSTGGSSGGVSLGGSSGGRVGPIRRLAAKLRSHGSGGGSTGGGGSSGGIVSSHGSGGGSVSYASPVSYTTPAISSSTSVPVQTISLGASADSYESPVVQSSYQAYSSPAPTVIDGGYYDSGVVSSTPISSDPVYSAPISSDPVYSAPMNDSGTVINGTVIDGGYETGTVIDSGSSILNTAPISSGETIIDSSSYESKKPAIGDDAGLLTVAVPNSSATVTVNGHSTSSEGTVRQFMSKGLEKGYVYTYVVKIDYELNGKTFADSKEVKLRPGDTKQVVFDADAEAKTAEPSDLETTKSEQANAKVITVVKLMVPSDAVVNLAGNDTNGAGPIRTFRTTALKAGEKWENYTVRVSTRIGGQLVSREQTVNVVAGSTTELEFDFEGLAKQ